MKEYFPVVGAAVQVLHCAAIERLCLSRTSRARSWVKGRLKK